LELNYITQENLEKKLSGELQNWEGSVDNAMAPQHYLDERYMYVNSGSCTLTKCNIGWN